ncbi:MAG: N-acetylmuramoyl-L-alanine amidase [Pseudomonadota bacterium]
MQFVRHKAKDAPFNRAAHVGGVIKPEIVVLHDTASRLETGNAARFLRDNDAKVSVHFVIERDGSFVQQVPVNRRGNHAGKSHYHGNDQCNNFSIGIEIVNPGRMISAGPGKARTWFKQTFDIAANDIHEITTPEHGHGLWMDYTDAQIDTLLYLLTGLFGYIPTLKDIVTHWYISPGRKVDTNPLFPLDHIKTRVLGRNDAVADEADKAATTPEQGDEMVQIEVPVAHLNMRRWPSFNPNVIATIPDGVHVPVIRKGLFAGRDWIKVQYAGLEGWIVACHTAPITFSTAAGMRL